MNNTHNITPQFRNESDENPSSNRFTKIEQLILQTPDVVYRYRLSPSPGFEFVNPAVEQITGFTPDEHYQQAGLGLKLLFPYDPEALKTLLPNNPSLKGLKALRFENHTESSTTEHISLPVYDLQGEIIAIEGIARDLTRWRSGDPAQNSTFQNILQLLNTSSVSLKHAASFTSAASVIGTGLVELCQAEHAYLFSISEQGALERLWTNLDHENGYGRAVQSLQDLVHLSSPLEITEFDWQVDFQDANATQGSPPNEPQSHTFSSITCPIYASQQLIAIGLCFQNGLQAFKNIQKQAVQVFCQQAGSALENIQLSSELEDAYTQSILALAKAIDAKDTYTSNHSHRLMKWAASVAIQMGCSSAEVEVIGWAALLHDIGKIGIPDHILHKPAELDKLEWQQMRRHPEIGADIVSHIKKLQSAIPFIRFHHEHYDGNGYPNGLRGDQIPLGARILSVVDAYGAMIDRRVYRPAKPPRDAIQELNTQSGLQFDPNVVRAFLRTLNIDGGVYPV